MIKNRKAAIGFIFITLLIDVTGLGLIIPVVPKLIEDLLHTTNISKVALLEDCLLSHMRSCNFYLHRFLEI